MQKLTFGVSLLLLVLLATNLQAQDDLKIKNASGTTLMEVREEGVLITKLTTNQRTANAANLGSAENGLIVYDTDTQSFWTWENPQWIEVDIDPTNEIELPTGGTDGQILSTDGAGNYAWTDAGTSTGGTIQGTDGNTYNIQAADDGVGKTVDLTAIELSTYTVPAGNVRGEHAVDLQTVRISSSQVASGDYSALLGGISNTASENYSTVAGGVFNSASGEFSAVIGGNFNSASGENSTVAGGSGNTSSGFASATLGGSFHTTSGDFAATVGGIFNTAPSFGETVVGLNNTDYTPNDSDGFNASDRIFTVGNGPNLANRSNALTILKNGNVGIGFDEPNNALQVNGTVSATAFVGDGSGLTGINLSGDDLGDHTATQNITMGSFTLSPDGTEDGIKFGVNNIFRIGEDNNSATETNSFVVGGRNNTASGPLSFITGGRFNEASNAYAFVVGGGFNEASGNYAFVLGGEENVARGYNANVVGGSLNTADTEGAIFGGFGNFATAPFATIIGGAGNQASGNYSFAMGIGTTVPSFGELVVGRYNTTYTPSSTTANAATDRLFVVGNGTDENNRSNALTILKNGSVGIGFDEPNNALEVNGTVSANTFVGDGSGLTGITISEVDGDPTNELQALSYNTTSKILTLSNGGTVDLSDLDNTLAIATAQTTADVALATAEQNETDLAQHLLDDLDQDPANEIQDLSINGQTLSISGGNNVTLPDGADNLGDHTATQNISLNDEWLSNDGDNEGIYVSSNGQVGVGTDDISTDLEVQGTVAELRITDDQIQASGAGTELGKISFYSRDGSFGNDYAPVGSIELVNTNGSATPDAAMEFHVWNNGSTITEYTPLVLYPSGKTEITGDLQISGGAPEAGQRLVAADDSGNTTWENAPKIAFTKDESIQTWDDTDAWQDITSPLSVSTTSSSLVLIQAQATVRLISGSNTDAFEFRAVATSTSDGCIQSEVFLNEIFHVPDTDSGGHNQWTTVPYMDNWNPGCAAGTATITLQVRNTGDDSWAVTDAILSLTSY